MNYYLITAVILLIVVTFIGFMEAVNDTIYFYKCWRNTPHESEMLSHGEYPGDGKIFRKSRKIQNDRFLGRGLLSVFLLIVLYKTVEYLFYILTM